MKKILLLIALLIGVSQCETRAQVTTKKVVVGLATKPGNFEYAPIYVTNGVLTANGLVATNGLTVSSGTVNFTGIGTLTIPNDKVAASAVVGITTSAGAADSGKIPKLNGSGVLDTTFLGASGSILTNVSLPSKSIGSGYTWVAVTNITTTRTTGTVVVTARAALDTSGGGVVWIRLRDASTNVVGVAMANTAAGGYGNPIATATLLDVLSGSTKTYFMECAANGAATVTNSVPSSAASPEFLGGNDLGMTIIQNP
jgi:hypothetical protein